MFLAQRLWRRSSAGSSTPAATGTKCPQRVEDNSDVDGFLRQRALDRSQPAKGGGDHRDAGQGHSAGHALKGDPIGTAGDADRIRYTIKPIDEDDDIRRL